MSAQEDKRPRSSHNLEMHSRVSQASGRLFTTKFVPLEQVVFISRLSEIRGSVTITVPPS